MAHGDTKAEAIKQLEALVDASSLSDRREELLLLFAETAGAFPKRACGHLMRAIERLVKEKARPEAEIQRLLQFSLSSDKAPNLVDALSLELPAQHKRMQYFLRIYILRILMADKDLELAVCILLTVAGSSDIGKIAVIDFALTRRRASRELMQLVASLRQSLQCKLEADSKRARAIERFCKPAHVDVLPLLDWNSIVTHTGVLANWTRLLKAAPEEISAWLGILRAQLDLMSEPERRALSATLTNLGPHFKHSRVVLDIFSCAVELESSLASPTPSVFTKVQRLLTAMRTHPMAEAAAVVEGLQTCFRHLGIDAGADRLLANQLKPFAGIVAALGQIAWGSLAQATLAADTAYQRPLAYFLVVTAGASSPLPERSLIDRLMRICVTHGEGRADLDLEQAYCAAYGECFDKGSLTALLSGSAPTELKSRALAILALGEARSDPLAAYHWCRQIQSADQFVSDVILECGYYDIAAALRIERPRPSDVPLHQLLAEVEKVKLTRESGRFTDVLLYTWAVLYRHGCFQDAAKYIRAAFSSTKLAYGERGVKHRAVRLLIKFFERQVHVDDGYILATTVEAGGELQGAAEHCARHWLQLAAPSSAPDASELLDRAEQSLTGKQPASLLLRSALVSPAAVAVELLPAAGGAGHSPLRALPQGLAELLSSRPGAAQTDWLTAAQLARRLERVDLMVQNTSGKLEPRLAGRQAQHASVFAPDSAGSVPINASRAFHTGGCQPQRPPRILPPDVVCVELSFDDRDALVVRRHERGGEPVTVRLPLQRLRGRVESFGQPRPWHYADLASYDAAMRLLEGTVRESLEPSTACASQFWSEQERLDRQMGGAIEGMQTLWLGGFASVLSAPAAALHCSQTEVDEVKCVFDAALGAALSRGTSSASAWSLHPTSAAMLRRAVEGGRAGGSASGIASGAASGVADLVETVLCSLVLQGVEFDVALLPRLGEQIAQALARKLLPLALGRRDADADETPLSAQRVVLVCDRRASAVPWELFPCLSGGRHAVTRALSLEQVCEWDRLRRGQRSEPGGEPGGEPGNEPAGEPGSEAGGEPGGETSSERREPSGAADQSDNGWVGPAPAGETGCYVINPANDLPATHKVFVQDFEKRGWRGVAGANPGEEAVLRMLRRGQHYVYMGHGSGKSYVRGSELRRLFAASTSVYLLGCNSVRMARSPFDDDALTDYAVMGSAAVMGTLWAVKDKDFNRFASEFFSRVFDERQSAAEALRDARAASVLPHLTGGAPVIYGLP